MGALNDLVAFYETLNTGTESITTVSDLMAVAHIVGAADIIPCAVPDRLDVVNVPGTASPYVRQLAVAKTAVALHATCGDRVVLEFAPAWWVAQWRARISGVPGSIDEVAARDAARTPAQLEAEQRQADSQLQQTRHDDGLAACQADDASSFHLEDLLPDALFGADMPPETRAAWAGGAIGTLAGAMTGGAIGRAADRPGTGAVLGAAAGGFLGQFLGRRSVTNRRCALARR